MGIYKLCQSIHVDNIAQAQLGFMSSIGVLYVQIDGLAHCFPTVLYCSEKNSGAV